MSLTTTGTEITEGKHYWEVELLSEDLRLIFIGISRPNINPSRTYWRRECTDAWFIYANDGGLYSNGKQGDDAAGAYSSTLTTVLSASSRTAYSMGLAIQRAA
jgi:hypothetical protein